MKPCPICADNGPRIPGVGARGGGSPGVALGAAAANVQRHGQLLGVNPGHHQWCLEELAPCGPSSSALCPGALRHTQSCQLRVLAGAIPCLLLNFANSFDLLNN